MKPTIYAPFLTLLAAAGCNNAYSPNGGPPAEPKHTIFAEQGDSASVATKLAEFRTALGGTLNAPNSPPATDGRREINWDGVPPALTNVDTFPATFFNVNSKRGALYATTGTGLRVDSTAFASTSADLPDQFIPFSGKKLFMAVGSNEVEVDFKLAGTTADGLVNGFGVVFCDVDRAGATRIEYFNAAGVRIGNVAAPALAGSHQFSFVGAIFDSAIVAKVRITSGEAALDGILLDSSVGGTRDLVVMDDFLYGEPQPLP